MTTRLPDGRVIETTVDRREAGDGYRVDIETTVWRGTRRLTAIIYSDAPLPVQGPALAPPARQWLTRTHRRAVAQLAKEATRDR